MELSEDELINIILSKRPDLTRDKLIMMIEDKVNEYKISRKTAIYLIMIELGISIKSPIERRVKFVELIEGLSNISIIGRILWLKPTEKYNDVALTRGGIMDESAILPILFWGRSIEDLKDESVFEGSIIEIHGAYTRSSLSGGLEIHVPKRSLIKQYKGDVVLPEYTKFLTPLNADLSRYTLTNVYGKVLSGLRRKIVKVNDESVEMASFLLGYGDIFKRVVLWRKVINEYQWVSPGQNIIIFLGRVKVNKFGDVEIHINRNSYIIEDKSIEVPLILKDSDLKSIKPGLNLLRVYGMVISKGIIRYLPDRNKYTQSFLIADEEKEATLVLIDDAIKKLHDITEGDVLAISLFRASVKGDAIYIFCDDTTILEKVDKALDVRLKIKEVTINKITLEDKIINIAAKLVDGPFEIGEFADIKYYIAEDRDGTPFKLILRGDLTRYAKDEIKVGDRIYIKAGYVDITPLLFGGGMPSIRLRAYSTIYKLQ